MKCLYSIIPVLTIGVAAAAAVAIFVVITVVAVVLVTLKYRYSKSNVHIHIEHNYTCTHISCTTYFAASSSPDPCTQPNLAYELHKPRKRAIPIKKNIAYETHAPSTDPQNAYRMESSAHS